MRYVFEHFNSYRRSLHAVYDKITFLWLKIWGRLLNEVVSFSSNIYKIVIIIIKFNGCFKVFRISYHEKDREATYLWL